MGEVLSGVFAVMLLLGAFHGFRLFLHDVLRPRLGSRLRGPERTPEELEHDRDAWRG